MHKWKLRAWYGFGLFEVIVFLIAAAKPANAYVDPGSGLLFLQMGGSILAGALFVLRAKIRKLFHMGNPEPTAIATDATAESTASDTAPGPHA